ncbi:MAG: bifunctional DNA-formamidopyrimidine glycosylase/DNA-(apurinic or apyrimidinic site) lyase [Terriglobia bacterium]
MPELPEVETVRRGLERRVLGRRISAIRVLRPGAVRGHPDLWVTGARVAGFRRKGKTLIMKLTSEEARPDVHLIIRLGMTGQLVITPREAPLLPHTHVCMLLDDGTEELRYRDPRRFGMLRLATAREALQILDSLGPDALEMTESEFAGRMRGRRGAIKGWLLNQQVLAGLGNIYADEALFEARIHPQTPAGELSKAARHVLYCAIRKVLHQAIVLQGTSFRDYIDIEGRPGNYKSRLRVYGKAGQPCARCSEPIERITICGRSSHFCPGCQRRSRTAV